MHHFGSCFLQLESVACHVRLWNDHRRPQSAVTHLPLPFPSLLSGARACSRSHLCIRHNHHRRGHGTGLDACGDGTSRAAAPRHPLLQPPINLIFLYTRDAARSNPNPKLPS